MTAAHDTQALAAIRDNARKFAEKHAAELARELIDWQDTGLLCGGVGGHLRGLAEMVKPFAGEHEMQVAESMAKRAALDALASRLQEQEGQPPTFPTRILTVLHELADRKGTPTHGPAEDANGEPLQDDADAALAWITARQEGQPALSERLNGEGIGDLIFAMERWKSACTGDASTSALNALEALIVRLGATLAAGSQAVQVPGWKLVPVEPTAEMLDEIRFLDTITDRALKARYTAMLAAAPLQPLAGGEVQA